MRAYPRSLVAAVAALLTVVLTACGSSSATNGTPAPVTLTVSAAASLTDAFNLIGMQFHTIYPNVTVTFNYAGSQQLSQQIVQGANVDVFASANAAQMQVVIQGGAVTAGSQKIFVKNRLEVIMPKNNPAKIAALGDLARPGLKIILADKSVPVGQYALDFLTKASADPTYGANYKQSVLKNVVSYEQDVKTVFSKVQLGEADAGIVYISDVSVNSDKVQDLMIPDTLNTIASYPIAAITASKHPTEAAQFINYVLSADGEAILMQYGFIPNPSGA